jgi:hypothetical protein
MDLKKTLTNINKTKKIIKPFYLISFGDKTCWYMVIAITDNYITIENGNNPIFTFDYNDEKERLKIDKGFHGFRINRYGFFEITPQFLELLKYKDSSFSLYMNEDFDKISKKIKEQLNQSYFL